MYVTVKNTAGDERRVKVGFSWTALFFGGFPYFFRGMRTHGLIYVAALCLFAILLVNIPAESAVVLVKAWALIVGLVLACKINRQTGEDLIAKGYTIVGNGWEHVSKKWDL